jgi:hypothetical protein
MIELQITKESIAEAKKLYDFGILNNSYTQGQGNKCGALGEVLVRQYYNGKQENTYDYDLVINTKKIDVKTKRFNARLTPTMKWTASLFDFNTKQKCDYYCFVGVADDYKKAYIYGFIAKDKFYKTAIFRKKGDVDPNGSSKWTFRADSYSTTISELDLNLK